MGRGQGLWNGGKSYGTGTREMGREQGLWDGDKNYGTETRVMGRGQELWDKSYGEETRETRECLCLFESIIDTIMYYTVVILHMCTCDN